jgi:hypothetical protein
MSFETRIVGFFGCAFWMPAASDRMRLSTLLPFNVAVARCRCHFFGKAIFRLAAVWQFHAFAQAAFATEAVEHPRNLRAFWPSSLDSRLNRSISSMTSMGITTCCHRKVEKRVGIVNRTLVSRM